jgi:hypothetical protein
MPRAAPSIRFQESETAGETRVRSRRALGTIAIVAIVVAAISFAVVDISTSAASGCLDTSSPCSERASPAIATLFAIIGSIALVAAIVPAIAWLVRALPGQQAARETEVDYSRGPSARVRDDDEGDPVTGG